MGLAVSEDAVRQHVPGYVSSVSLGSMCRALQPLFTWATLVINLIMIRNLS